MSIRSLIACLLLLAALPARAWWHCDWAQRFAADINAAGGPPQTNYVVRLDLDSGNVPAGFDWSANGEDLRVIAEDDLTPLDFLVEQWDAGAQTATVWVLLPQLNGVRRVYVYFDGPAIAPPAWELDAMPQLGTLFHTRQSTVDPANRAQAEAAFANGQNAAGYGCASPDAFVNINNAGLFAPPTRNSNIVLFAEVFFEVQAADVGTWQFRYGADFGRGGGLYVDDVVLEEDWNNDLWWNFNWNNASEVLQGSIALGEGLHSLRILGSEGCCDGGLTVQFQRPGGPWLDLTTSNIELRARQCSNRPEPAVTYLAGETSACPDLTVIRTSSTFSDPTNLTVNPKAIPGAVILNTIEVRNAGVGAIDTSTFVVTEAIAVEAALQVANFDGATNGPVQFIDGANSSGLVYTFVALGDTGDSLSFSNDGGATFNYTPVPDPNGIDTAVTHLQISPTGSFAGNGGSGYTSAQFLFKTQVQ